MKQIFLILVFTVYSLFALSKNNNVKKYYQYIQLAENNVVKGDLIQARKYYKKAFQLEIAYFGYDIRNALKVESELTPDSSSVYWCFRTYIKIGFDGYKKEERIKSNYKFFYGMPYWTSIQTMLDTIKTNFNDELTIKLQVIYTLDQSVRVYNAPGMEGFVASRDEINRIDSSNVVNLLGLLEKYTINETTVQSELLFDIIRLVLAHNRGHGKEYKNVNELFKVVKQEVLKGNFDARIYAHNFDRRYSEVIKKEKPPRAGFYGTEIYFATNQFFLTRLLTNNRIAKEINKHRKKIYLDDYLSNTKKIMFQYKLSEDVFSLHYEFGLFNYAFPPNGEAKFFNWVKESNIEYDIYYKKE